MKLMKSVFALVLILTLTLHFSGCMLLSEPEPETIVVSKATANEKDYEAKLNEVLSILDQYYIDGYETTDLGDYLAEAAVAASGDRWSYYMTAAEYAEKQEEDNNAYVGIGVTVQMVHEDDPGFTVIDVTKDGGAEAAGLRIDDIIVAVEGKDAVELQLEGVKNAIRGEEGTEVTITVLRGDKQFDVTVTRKLIQIEVVTYELLQDEVGYIKIAQFSNDTSALTIAAIEDLRAQGATGLVFDLRFNPGGFKNELVKLLDYLLPAGALFRSVDYQGNTLTDTSSESCLEMPMSVLINEDSYSAAEFFAAALQEYDWATIVGTQTTGKANYQQTFKLSDGSAIAISTGHYKTPNGVVLEGIGVTPDVIVKVDQETYQDLYYGRVTYEDDEQLQKAIQALK